MKKILLTLTLVGLTAISANANQKINLTYVKTDNNGVIQVYVPKVRDVKFKDEYDTILIEKKGRFKFTKTGSYEQWLAKINGNSKSQTDVPKVAVEKPNYKAPEQKQPEYEQLKVIVPEVKEPEAKQPEYTAPKEQPKQQSYTADEFERKFIELQNEYRMQNGKEPLNVDSDITAMVKERADKLSQDSQIVSGSKTRTGHVFSGQSFKDAFEKWQSQINVKHLAENVTMSWDTPLTPQTALNNFKNSAGHNRNMLKDNINAVDASYINIGSFHAIVVIYAQK